MKFATVPQWTGFKEVSKVKILVVDLDGTLIQSDMLFETLWASLARTWFTVLVGLASLFRGRAALKRYLSQGSSIDAALLPYNEQVLDYIQRWREGNGGRVALVTASDQLIADAVAAHLGIFDEAYGSNGSINLKGRAKAQYLVERFGEKGFAYIGDAKADLAVWEKAEAAVTVNASKTLRRRVEALAPAEHLSSSEGSIRAYLKCLRPHQWLKNALVFVPMLTAHRLTIDAAVGSMIAFVAFSLVASCVYVMNDLLDLAADRMHPRKRFRPFASGRVPLAHGTLMAPLLLGAGLGCAAFLGWKFTAVLIAYFIVTTAYSLDLKRRMIIDICVLAGLYTMRIVAGGAATDITLSVWLLAFSVFFFLSLASVKRYAELVDGASSGKAKVSGRGYLTSDTPVIGAMMIASGYVAVLIMALYVNSPTVSELYKQPAALWGICLILLYWISRTAMVTHRGWMNDDPVVFAVKDRISQVCLVLILMCAIGGAML